MSKPVGFGSRDIAALEAATAWHTIAGTAGASSPHPSELLKYVSNKTQDFDSLLLVIS